MVKRQRERDRMMVRDRGVIFTAAFSEHFGVFGIWVPHEQYDLRSRRQGCRHPAPRLLAPAKRTHCDVENPLGRWAWLGNRIDRMRRTVRQVLTVSKGKDPRVQGFPCEAGAAHVESPPPAMQRRCRLGWRGKHPRFNRGCEVWPIQLEHNGHGRDAKWGWCATQRPGERELGGERLGGRSI